VIIIDMDDPRSVNNGIRMDVELVTRTSLSSLREVDDGRIVSPNSFDEWTWSGLRVSDRLIMLEPIFIGKCLKNFNRT